MAPSCPWRGERQQDSCYSWVVCVSATLSTAVTLGFLTSFGVFYPVLLDYFKESKDKTGINQVMISY